MIQLGPKKFLYSPYHFRSGRSASWFTSTCSYVTAMIYFIVTLNTGDETTASNGLWFNKLWWMVVQGATTISPKTTKITGGDESVWHHHCILSLIPTARSLSFMTSEYANSTAEILFFLMYMGVYHRMYDCICVNCCENTFRGKKKMRGWLHDLNQPLRPKLIGSVSVSWPTDCQQYFK